ncbi:Malectin-A [Taenia crassiceps]|uniref:Malectin-A n=1 Tax=Taenia crassiceps TaxID=6207 RepID=A0ABR4QGH6_9CEST
MICVALSFVFCLEFCDVFAVKLNPVFAVNCGGDAHVDSNGVWYAADFNNRGIASGHGLNLVMHRVHESDAVLYQTERYDVSSFYYEFPFPDDGHYVLHLKFSEVWFQYPHGKVFSVELNGGLRIIQDLDIFQKAGFSVAYDENIPFTIKDGSILVGDTSVKVSNDEKLRITFVKGNHDNPKTFLSSLHWISSKGKIVFIHRFHRNHQQYHHSRTELKMTWNLFRDLDDHPCLHH